MTIASDAPSWVKDVASYGHGNMPWYQMGETSGELFRGFRRYYYTTKHGGHFFNNNSGGSFLATAKHGGWDIACTSDLVAKTMASFVFGPSVFSSGKHGG